MKLKDKVAIVTGASRGMGRATALLFAKEGAKVVVDYFVSDYEPDADANAQKVVKEIEDLGSMAIAVSCDVTSEEQVKELVKAAMDKFGKIDILVNNAGIVFDLPFRDRSLEQWHRTVDTIMLGTFLCSKYASEKMKKGAIVNISSTNGINAFNPESMDYDAAKAGVLMLTKNLAMELAPNIRVNAVAPGWVNTDMNKDLPADFVKTETEKIYQKRFAEPEEIAKSTLFLASDDASYVTGSILNVDGGY